MKKTIQILFFSLLTVGATAQKKAAESQPQMKRAIERSSNAERIGNRPVTQPTQTSSNRDVIFHETFENGYNGTTEYGAWTHSFKLTGVPSTQGEMWSIGQPGYENAYGGAGDALESDSPTNWALWDGGAYYDLYPSTGDPDGSNYTGYLNAPTIDCSELESVVVSFQQVFRYCCFSDSPISLDVSVDGGITWSSFDAIGNGVEGANIQSANPLNTVIDISCIASGEPNVKLRFAYNSAEEAGYTHYYWGIDEVKVYSNTVENDLFISAIANGDVLNFWEFRTTPEQQIRTAADGGVIAAVLVGNKGVAEQSDITVTVKFTSPTGVEYTSESDPFHLYSSATDTICPASGSVWMTFATDFVPTEMGEYTMSATINGLEEGEETMTDNTLSKTISFNNIGEYGHDPNTTAEFEWQIGSRFVSGTSGPRAPSGFGSYYAFVNPNSQAHGITVRFGSNTVPGVEFQAALIKRTLAQGEPNLDNSPLVGSGNYETREGWNTGEPLYFAFNSPTPQNGVFPALPVPVEVWNDNTNPVAYVAAIWRQNAGLGNMTVLADDLLDLDYSSVTWEKGGDQAYHWFSAQDMAFGVRLVLEDGNHIAVSTDEVAVPKASFSVYPNPAVTEARVAFDLTESTFIAYEVRDLQGRLMDTDNIGRFAAGQNSFSLNVSNYPAGNYIVGLVLEGKRIMTQQISVIK